MKIKPPAPTEYEHEFDYWQRRLGVERSDYASELARVSSEADTPKREPAPPRR